MANEDATITVALGADSAYARQLAVVLVGLSDAASAGDDHQVFVLHEGIDRALRERIGYPHSTGNRIRVEWLEVSSDALRRAWVPAQLASASCLRLLLPEVLPSDVQKVLYLDADVIVRRPLGALWSTDFDGHLLAAALDAGVPWAAAPFGLPWREVGAAPDQAYFNSGVMLIALDRWREERLGHRALALMEQREFLHGDQCALNIVAEGRFTRLSPRWNLQGSHLHGESALAWVVEDPAELDSALEESAIVHFNKDVLRRPWLWYSNHPYRQEWFEYLDRTDWAGWRPEIPSLLQRGVSRVRRAARELTARPSAPFRRTD